MANEIIVTTRAELEEIVSSSLRSLLPELAHFTQPRPKPMAERLTPDEAAIFLQEQGYKYSKNTLYALVSKGEVPYEKSGKYLMFATNELLAWARARSRKGRTNDDSRREAEEHLRKAARRA